MTLALKKKKTKKCTNHSELKYEIAKIWKIVIIVIGALRIETKHFEKWIEKLDLDLTLEALQKPCLPGMARIIRKMLDMKRGEKRVQYLRQLVGVRYCGIFYQKITSDLRVKKRKSNNNNNFIYSR